MIDISDNRKIIVVIFVTFGVLVCIIELFRGIQDPSLFKTVGGLASFVPPIIIFGLAYVFHARKYESIETKIAWVVIILIAFNAPETLPVILVVFLVFEIQKKQIDAKMNQPRENTKTGSIAPIK